MTPQEQQKILNGKCLTCECDEGLEPQDLQCYASRRPCGHHCNHSWTHDECCWCGKVWEGDE